MALVDVSICFIQDLVQHMCMASCTQQASMCLLMPGNAQGSLQLVIVLLANVLQP